MAYLVRIYVNLLIEPQVNPIKHFPVVTVSHKMILPLSGHLIRWMAAPLIPLVGKQVGLFIAATNMLLLPGIFGFLVWELKENWRLYEANRSATLRPVIVGEHGETMVRLLRPGFHSGTLPKLFAKLRKAERRALRGGHDQKALKHAESLHHIEESIRRFIDRDFLALARPEPFARGSRDGAEDDRTGDQSDPARASCPRDHADRPRALAHLRAARRLAGRVDRGSWMAPRLAQPTQAQS